METRTNDRAPELLKLLKLSIFKVINLQEKNKVLNNLRNIRPCTPRFLNSVVMTHEGNKEGGSETSG